MSPWPHTLLSSCPSPSKSSSRVPKPANTFRWSWRNRERLMVHFWLRNSAHVSPDRGAIPSAASYILWFCIQAIMVGNEDACQCLNLNPNNVFHRVLPLPINLVHSWAYLCGGLNPEEFGHGIRHEIIIDFLSCDKRTIIKGYCINV